MNQLPPCLIAGLSVSSSNDQRESTLSAPDIEITDQVIEVVTDEPTITKEKDNIKQYTNFVDYFKSHRIKLGYNLNDVIHQIAIRYGQMISLTYITDFEGLILPEESYAPLMIILDNWIKDSAKASGSYSSEHDASRIITLPATGIYPQRARKKKTTVEACVKMNLEEEFAKKKTPTLTELQKIAKRLGVEKDFVRNWFCNRRRREKCEGKKPLSRRTSAAVKKVAPSPKALPAQINPSSQSQHKIPSELYDITIEVPSIHPRDIASPSHTLTIH